MDSDIENDPESGKKVGISNYFFYFSHAWRLTKNSFIVKIDDEEEASSEAEFEDVEDPTQILAATNGLFCTQASAVS